MLIPGYQPVDAPTAQVPRSGLIRSAIEVPEGDERWVGGFTYEPESCDPALAVAITCDPGDVDPEDPVKVPGDNPLAEEYVPWAVVGRDRCSALQRDRDRRGRAERQLRATESFQMERELELGSIARAESLPNRYLAQADIVTELASAGATIALAALEDALAECLHGARGMIHATVFTATVWNALGLLRTTDQGILLTANDSIVVAGSGYTGAGPGADAGDAPVAPADIRAAAWAYGTGLVYVRRGQIVEVGDARSQVDRATNTWTTFVERPVAAIFDRCCVIGIEVDHTNSGVGDGSIDGGTP
jgi:hypothetical protein